MSLHNFALHVGFCLALLPAHALAYRPFNSTDPAVADRGEWEIELSPLSYRHDNSGRTWIAPQLQLNYGFAEDYR